MPVIINGQEKTFAKDCPLQTIIGSFNKDPKHIIAEVNGELIKTPYWPQTLINDGDRIELVTLVGGG